MIADTPCYDDGHTTLFQPRRQQAKPILRELDLLACDGRIGSWRSADRRKSDARPAMRKQVSALRGIHIVIAACLIAQQSGLVA